MDKANFKLFIKELKNQLMINRNIIDKAINEEMSKGKCINFDKINTLISEYENVDEFYNEKKIIAIRYSGMPEITMEYILDSIVYNNRITFCITETKILNNLLIEFAVDSLINCKIKNQWIDYQSSYNDIYLKDHQKFFHKIIFIGDYFEYQRFSGMMSRKIEYNNFGHIKLFLDKNIYSEEYKKIMEYAYKENLYIEIYNDVEDFINESRSEDFAIVFADFKTANQINRELRADEIMINAFPYDSYRFKIER